MIYIQMNGRLGNQLFMYANAYTFSRDNGDEPISFDWYTPNRLNVYQLKNVAGDGKIRHSIVTRFVRRYYSKKFRSLPCEKRKAEELKLWPKQFRYGIFLYQHGYYPMKRADCKRKNVELIGYFQSEKYFVRYKDEIKEMFRSAPKPMDNPFYQKILHTKNAVCVEVRLGDYLKYPSLMVCTENYFKKAMQYMASVLDHPTFFVFSENTDIARKIFADLDVDIEYESGLGEDYEVLQIISACEHFIISNSSFGWWGQYLSKNEEKIVIAPNRWNNAGWQTDVYMDQWKLLDPDTLEFE